MQVSPWARAFTSMTFFCITDPYLAGINVPLKLDALLEQKKNIKILELNRTAYWPRRFNG